MEQEYFEFIENKIAKLNNALSEIYLSLKLMNSSDKISQIDKRFFKSLFNDSCVHFDKWTNHLEEVQTLKSKNINERKEWYD